MRSSGVGKRDGWIRRCSPNLILLVFCKIAVDEADTFRKATSSRPLTLPITNLYRDGPCPDIMSGLSGDNKIYDARNRGRDKGNSQDKTPSLAQTDTGESKDHHELRSGGGHRCSARGWLVESRCRVFFNSPLFSEGLFFSSLPA